MGPGLPFSLEQARRFNSQKFLSRPAVSCRGSLSLKAVENKATLLTAQHLAEACSGTTDQGPGGTKASMIFMLKSTFTIQGTGSMGSTR